MYLYYLNFLYFKIVTKHQVNHTYENINKKTFYINLI
jgi:hypothetical protein